MNENGNEHDDMQINIERFGPGPEAIDEVTQATLNHPSVQEYLGETWHRLISVQLLKSATRANLMSQYPWIVQIDGGISAAPSQTGESQLNAPANIGSFVNGENIVGRDMVVWYGAHFTHDVYEEEVGHIVGPVLRPAQW